MANCYGLIYPTKNPGEFMLTNILNMDYDAYTKDYNQTRYILDKLAREHNIKCPICNHKVYLHGVYDRYVIFYESKYPIKIFQVKCLNTLCGKVHSVIPVFVEARKHYAAQVIDEAVSNTKIDLCPADNRTIKRWKKLNRAKDSKLIK